MHGGDNRLFRCSHRTDETHRRWNHLSLPWLFHEVFQVVAGGEGIASALQQDHADGRIGFGLIDGVGQRVIHFCGQSIFLLGTVDGNVQHSAAAFDFDVRHGSGLVGIELVLIKLEQPAQISKEAGCV